MAASMGENRSTVPQPLAGSFQVHLFHFRLFLVRGRRKQNDLFDLRLQQTPDQRLHSLRIAFQRKFTAPEILRIGVFHAIAVTVHIIHSEHDEHLVRLKIEQVHIHAEQSALSGSAPVPAVERLQINSRITGEIIIPDKTVIRSGMSQAVSEKRHAVSGLKRLYHHQSSFQ